MIPAAAIPAPMMSCISIVPPVLWRYALLSPIVGATGAVCGLATPSLRRGAGAHAQFALPVDKTHKIQVRCCIAYCMDKP